MISAHTMLILRSNLYITPCSKLPLADPGGCHSNVRGLKKTLLKPSHALRKSVDLFPMRRWATTAGVHLSWRDRRIRSTTRSDPSTPRWNPRSRPSFRGLCRKARWVQRRPKIGWKRSARSWAKTLESRGIWWRWSTLGPGFRDPRSSPTAGLSSAFLRYGLVVWIGSFFLIFRLFLFVSCWNKFWMCSFLSREIGWK